MEANEAQAMYYQKGRDAVTMMSSTDTIFEAFCRGVHDEWASQHPAPTPSLPLWRRLTPIGIAGAAIVILAMGILIGWVVGVAR